MPNRPDETCRVTDQLAASAEVLRRVGLTALHVQARASLQERQISQIATRDTSAIARATTETETGLRAMSRYGLEHLLPRTQALLTQIEGLSSVMAGYDVNGGSPIAEHLQAAAGELDRCRVILRGHARRAPRGASMIRFGEQRLWGALAVELQRIEGSEGPMMHACGRIEKLASELAFAIEELLKEGEPMPLARRFAFGTTLIESSGRMVMCELELQKVIEPYRLDARQFARPMALLTQLAGQYRDLCKGSQQVAAALCIATQANAQFMVTGLLEKDLQALDRLLCTLATDYRGLMRLAPRAMGRELVARRLEIEVPLWRKIAAAIAEPLALSRETPDTAAPMARPPLRSAGQAALQQI
uniref:hypothetical protein n=1 Tax=Paracoccus sp. TRP TaxID=412597 RepID=UPI000225F1BB|nr:hypothetical protein [Paracoccus sp. TRP]